MVLRYGGGKTIQSLLSPRLEELFLQRFTRINQTESEGFKHSIVPVSQM